MSNEAQHLLNHIQYKTGKSLSVIAKEIGYSRPHLNKAKLNPIEGGKIVGILKTKYVNELEDVPRFESITIEKQHKPEPSLLEALMQKLITVTDTTNRLLERQEKQLLDKVDNIDTNLNLVSAQTQKISLELESGRMVALMALSRLEKKPVNELIDEADSIKDGLIMAKNEIYKTEQDRLHTGKRK